PKVFAYHECSAALLSTVRTLDSSLALLTNTSAPAACNSLAEPYPQSTPTDNRPFIRAAKISIARSPIIRDDERTRPARTRAASCCAFRTPRSPPSTKEKSVRIPNSAKIFSAKSTRFDVHTPSVRPASTSDASTSDTPAYMTHSANPTSAYRSRYLETSEPII